MLIFFLLLFLNQSPPPLLLSLTPPHLLYHLLYLLLFILLLLFLILLHFLKPLFFPLLPLTPLPPVLHLLDQDVEEPLQMREGWGGIPEVGWWGMEVGFNPGYQPDANQPDVLVVSVGEATVEEKHFNSLPAFWKIERMLIGWRERHRGA